MPGKWVPLKNQPQFPAGLMLLLTDGSVFVQDSGSINPSSSAWWRLVPDDSGSYLKGTWQARNALGYPPIGYASAVLKDGSAVIAGGEHIWGFNTPPVWIPDVSVYDPTNDSWATRPGPWNEVGDAPSVVLPDGRFMIGSVRDNKIAIFDPTTAVWKPAAPKLAYSSTEESWVLLRDGSVLTVDCKRAPGTPTTAPDTSERYLPLQDKWVPAGTLPQILVNPKTAEIGPALLLPDGRAFFIGATGRTALYPSQLPRLPPLPWASGPDILDAKGHLIDGGDAPAVLLPNGQVLFAGGPMGGVPAETYFFEFNPAANRIEQVRSPPNANTHPSYQSYLLLLPTGEVLHSDWSTTMAIYTPEQTMPQNAWRPTITSCPRFLVRGVTATLKGRQLNGLSQANCFGDDGMSATNYPLVRLTYANGQVLYLRTHDHSSMGVATGTAVVSTRFDVKKDGVANDVPLGDAVLEVVANGIASAPMNVVIVRPKPPYAPGPWQRQTKRKKAGATRKTKKAKTRRNRR